MIDETYTPDSRFEEYMKHTILKKGTAGLPTPQSRAEELLWELCELISNGESGSTTPGPQGEKGDPGDSAYQVAVTNGFVGSESAWLESLKGANGKTPVRGTDYWTEVDIAEINKYIDAKVAEATKPSV